VAVVLRYAERSALVAHKFAQVVQQTIAAVVAFSLKK